MKLPPPLVPPECTTSGNDWMPLYGDRLMRSKWWRRASDTARARNVMLWWRAFRESPAGSLPDDDDDLAEAAGYGFDIEAWSAVKAEIMSAWSLCSDGRWYHPTVCEVVLDTWERTSERRRKSAEKKAAQRAAVRGAAPKESPATTDDVPGDAQPVPGDIATQTDMTDRQTEEEAKASLSSADDEDPGKYPEAFEADWKAYPHAKGRSSKKLTFAQWRRLSKARRAALPSAIARFAREGYEPKAPCGAPAMERWLQRELDLNWAPVAGSAGADLPRFPGPAGIRAAAVAAKGEDWVVSWLDRCDWDDAGSLVIPKNPDAARKLREISQVLGDLNVYVGEPRKRAAA